MPSLSSLRELASRISWSSPWVAFLLLLAAFALTLLLTPRDTDGRSGDRRLTVRSTAPQGASGLYEAAARLGWRTERLQAPFAAHMDSAAVYAVLDPPVALTAGEVHRLLESVRAGAGLLVVAERGSALADSLGLEPSRDGGLLVAPAGVACADSLNRPGALRWMGGGVITLRLQGARRPAGAVAFAHTRRPGRPDSTDLASAVPDAPGDSLPPAVLGIPLGRGRVVVVADPDLLRNDVLRVCEWGMGVAAFRALDWLSQAGGRRLVFDEYHQSAHAEAAPMRAVRRWLAGTPPGRMLLQGVLAALVLLAALGARAIAPLARPRIERRSPLEHVSALARAYDEVHATRLAMRRLVRGLRRRHQRAASRPTGDDEFLSTVATRHRILAGDVDRVRAAEREPLEPDGFVQAGQALHRIDSQLTT